MVVRWAAASFMDAEENYRKIMGWYSMKRPKATTTSIYDWDSLRHYAAR